MSDPFVITPCCPTNAVDRKLIMQINSGVYETYQGTVDLYAAENEWNFNGTIGAGDRLSMKLYCAGFNATGFRGDWTLNCNANPAAGTATYTSGSCLLGVDEFHVALYQSMTWGNTCKCLQETWPSGLVFNIYGKAWPIPAGTPMPWASCDPQTPTTPCDCGWPTRPQGGTSGSGGCSTGLCTSGGRVETSSHPVRYLTGEVVMLAEDLVVGGYGVPWGHRRSFSSRLSQNVNVGNGVNWQVAEWPYLLTDGDTKIVMGRTDQVLWFDAVGDGFAARYGMRQTLSLNPRSNHYELRDLDGNVTEFSSVNGAFRRRTDAAGNALWVSQYADNFFTIESVDRLYRSGGHVTVERLTYAYSSGSTTFPFLTSVTLQRRVDAGSWENVQKVEYTYYGTSDTHGAEGDLKSVTTQDWNGSTWDDTGTTVYRYWLSTGSSSSSSGAAAAHLLKYVLQPASYVRMVEAGNDPLTASDGLWALFADYYFEYDAQRRVTKELVQAGSQTFLFAYEESGFADDPNAWKMKTTETLPDGSQNIVYSNYAGRTMLTVFQSEGDEWRTFQRFNASQQTVLSASPSAVIGYNDTLADLLDYDTGSGTYALLRDDVGLIRTSDFDTASGYLARESVQEGQLATPTILREYEYVRCCATGSSSSSSSSSSSGGCAENRWFTKREIVYPSEVNPFLTQVTSYAYTFHFGTCAIQEQVTTLPVVSQGENGTGIAATRRDYFDVYGNLTWSMDERGFITRMSYDIPTGAIIQRIDDVDTGLYGDVPAGWATPSGGGLNLITDFEHDDRGRITQTLGPAHQIDRNGSATTIRRATWVVYEESDIFNETRTAQGYATGGSYTLVNPVSITRTDLSGRVQEQIQAVRASTSGKLLPSDAFAQSSYSRWQTTQYTDCCIIASTRVYHTIPASGEGDPGSNYDETGYGYDVRKRRNRIVTPGGTITRTVIDARGLVTSTWIGTDDTGGTATDPSGGGAPGNNMKIVTANVFDDGEDGGDGYLTEQTQYVTASDTRVTASTYDFRGRRLTTDGEIDFFQQDAYDNLSRVIQSERFDTTDEGNLIARSETLYDARGRVYQTVRYAVDPETGDVGNALVDNTWYDPSGHVLATVPAGSSLFTKTEYDSLGRAIVQSSGFNPEADLETPLGDGSPDSIDDDVLLEQSFSVYDEASNVIQATQKQRYHNASTAQLGALQNPSTTPKARVTYAAMYPDAIGRTQASANYGTNGGTSLSRPSTIPARSDTVLVTSQSYNSAGNLSTTTDPAGMRTCFEYDDAGRETAKILNCQSSSSSSSSSSGGGTDDVNVTVLTAYNADGNVASLTAVNAVTGNQVTQYVYGTTLADSELATSTLKRKEIYPDSVDTDDVIAFTYNRQQQVTTVTDQQGTVHSYNFDKLGRQTQDRVTTLGSGVDSAVQRIATTYEVRGMKETITSYDNATVGSGSVLNQCQFEYNDFGQLVTEYQSHSGTVNVSTTPQVQYTFADGSANTIRPTGMVYPNGRELSYDYGTSDGIDDRASRIASIIDDDDTHLADYRYLGRQTFVEQDDTEPQMKWTLIDLAGSNDPDTGDIYTGLDRFGRVKNNRWYNYDADEDVDRIQYGYDRASNRIWRKNVVAAALGKQFDELYTYDGVHRLQDMVRGTLNGGHTALTSETFAESWTLDSTGNWRGFKQDDNGDGTWSLIQSRTANPVNEITDIAESVGPNWVTPAYNRAGNMTTMPQPADPTASYTATYDAWNRLVKIADGADTVSEYAYDGTKRRIVQKSYGGGILDETRHLYYTEPSLWQVIEERVGTSPDSADAERQFVWGKRYIDDLVVRDRDTDGNGSLNERLYACQDANWNVTAVIDDSETAQERYAYSAYGVPSFLTPAFIASGSSGVSWETLYCGYRYDTTLMHFDVRNRAYGAAIGSWLQRDPLTFIDGANLYQAYFILSGTDPYGTSKMPPLEKIVPCKVECRKRFERGEVRDFNECVRNCLKSSPRYTVDQTKIWQKCCSITAACPNCTKADCERALSLIIEAVNKTWLPICDGLYVGTNTCQRWAIEVGTHIPTELTLSPCVRNIGVYAWTITGGTAATRHAAYHIQLCDGTTIYLDNGGLGGGDHIFTDIDIPGGFVPIE